MWLPATFGFVRNDTFDGTPACRAGRHLPGYAAEACKCRQHFWADTGSPWWQEALPSVFPVGTGRWDFLERDASATGAQMDLPRRSLIGVREVSARNKSV